MVEGECMTHGAPLTIRRNYRHFSQLTEGLGQCHNTWCMNTVIVGHQDFHPYLSAQ
jgi:hypothetical protein